MLSNNQIPIPIFNGENYDYWDIKMRTFFMSQGLWDIVDNGFNNPADISRLTKEEKEKLDKDREKDNMALYNIQMAMEDSIFLRVCGATSAQQAWDNFKEEFQGSVKVRNIKLQTLRRDMANLKMKESETIKEYYSRLRELVNQLRSYGEDYTDKMVVEKILISLPSIYDPIVTTTEATADLTTLSVTDLVGTLEAYEKRLSMHETESTENAFQSKLNIRSQNSENVKKFGDNSRIQENSRIKEKGGERREKYLPCSICNMTSHLEKDCWHKGKPKCQNCDKFGHIQKDCRLNKKYQANYSEENEDEGSMFYTCHAAAEVKNNTWYVDSGCSNHMTGDENIFKEIDRSVKSQVKLGNGELVEVEGKGTIAVNTKKGTRFIRDVLLVPKLDTNLLSVGQMMERGYSLYFNGDSCKIYDNKNKNQEIATVKMQYQRNFPIRWQYAEMALKEQEDQSWLWHCKFGHFNFHGLKILHDKKMMKDLPAIQTSDDVCERCLQGKQHRKPFPTGKAWRAKKILELLHTDVCGPMRTTTFEKNRYFILFIDDYSRMTWVYFMRERSEVFGIFKKFKNLVENQSGTRIKVIRSDRGKEYTSNQFNKFCEDEGVEHQLTVGYAPEQNGVSERKNRTIEEMAKSMLAEKNMPKEF